MHISSLSSLHTPPITTLLRHRSLSIRAVDTVQSFDYKICNDFKITTKLNISVVNVGQFLAKPRINPLGFRLGATQSHHSVWFSQPKNYSQGLEEDKKIRDFIKNYAPNKNITSSGGTQKKKEKSSGVKGISRILIQKRIDLIQVVIYMKSPELLIGNRPGGIEELQTELQKELNCVNRKVNIDITRIANPNANPYILAEFIAEQLEKRVSCRKAMKKAIELAEKTNIKGIQVQIKGRIDGKEIARVEWIREGRVPLQTIRAKIDYCAYMVQTKYGMVGIKIWIYTDDE